MRLDTSALPPYARAVIYWVYGIAGVALGSCEVAFRAAELDQPVWLTVGLAVYAYLGIAVGMVAATNTPVGYQPERLVEDDDLSDETQAVLDWNRDQ